MNNPLDQIIDRIINNTEEDYDEEEITEKDLDNRNKINFIYLKKVLDLINEVMDNFVNLYGKDLAKALIISVINGETNPIAEKIMEDHFSELKPTISDIYEYEDLDSYLAKASTKELERFLLLIGISPMYAQILRKYFGDNGALTIYTILESAATGQLDKDIIINSLMSKTNE